MDDVEEVGVEPERDVDRIGNPRFGFKSSIEEVGGRTSWDNQMATAQAYEFQILDPHLGVILRKCGVEPSVESLAAESFLGTNQQSLRKDLWSGYGLLSISKKDGTGASETMSAVLTSSHSWGGWALGIKPA